MVAVVSSAASGDDDVCRLEDSDAGARPSRNWVVEQVEGGAGGEASWGMIPCRGVLLKEESGEQRVQHKS